MIYLNYIRSICDISKRWRIKPNSNIETLNISQSSLAIHRFPLLDLKQHWKPILYESMVKDLGLQEAACFVQTLEKTHTMITLWAILSMLLVTGVFDCCVVEAWQTLHFLNAVLFEDSLVAINLVFYWKVELLDRQHGKLLYKHFLIWHNFSKIWSKNLVLRIWLSTPWFALYPLVVWLSGCCSAAEVDDLDIIGINTSGCSFWRFGWSVLV